MKWWGFGRRRHGGSDGHIREFAYLDEVSVESLLASVDGEILVQSTNTKSRSVEAGLSAQANGKTPFGTASFAPTLKSSRGSEVQELRKSVAQSAFARFRAKNFHRFVIRPMHLAKVSSRQQKKIDSLDPKTLRKLGQGIPLSELRRGDLIELETDLVAADIFKARTAISAVADVIEAYPSFATIELRDQMKLARPLTSLIDSLNGNAIPVVGQNPNVHLTQVGEEIWLVNASPSNGIDGASNLALEGQALQPWFWGDVGSILFRPARFRMLCRVLNCSLTDTPSGSYIGTILRTIDDGLAETVDGMGSMFLGALRTGHHEATNQRGIHPVTQDAISAYVAALAAVTGKNDLALPTAMHSSLLPLDLKALSTSAQTDLFQLIDVAVGVNLDAVSDDDLGNTRDNIRTEFGLWPWSVSTIQPRFEEESETTPSYLEVAIVAVYW